MKRPRRRQGCLCLGAPVPVFIDQMLGVQSGGSMTGLHLALAVLFMAQLQSLKRGEDSSAL